MYKRLSLPSRAPYSYCHPPLGAEKLSNTRSKSATTGDSCKLDGNKLRYHYYDEDEDDDDDFYEDFTRKNSLLSGRFDKVSRCCRYCWRQTFTRARVRVQTVGQSWVK